MTIVPSLPRVVVCKYKDDDAARTRRTVLLCRRWVDNVRDVAKRRDGRIITWAVSAAFFMVVEIKKAGRKRGDGKKSERKEEGGKEGVIKKYD